MKHPTVLGVGIYDSDGSIPTARCPYYTVWHAMLVRVYSTNSRHKNPRYINCSVHPDWHVFSTFKKWMELQDWQGKCLDKDLLVPGNRTYGPDTCLFVSKKINSLLNTQPNKRGNFPLGVHPWGNRYKATIKRDMKSCHIGVYDSVEEAFKAYCNAKADWVETIAAKESCHKTRLVLLREAGSLRKMS